MKTHLASSISASIADLRVHEFGTAIVQKRAPGLYTYEFGKGTFAVEAVVSFLLSDAKNPGAMQTNVDSLSTALLDNAMIRRAWDKLFTSPTQSLSLDQQLFSVNDVQAAFASSLGSKAMSGITSTLTEILVDAFSGARFVSRTEGYSYREERLGRHPDENDLAREFLRQELVSALKSEPMRIRIDAKKFTPTFLRSEFERLANKLGRGLAKLGYNYDALHDSMYVVYTALNDRGGLHTRLPAEVINSGEFAELAGNLTFVLAAYALAPKKARDGQWNLRNNMSKTIQILNLSDRFDIISLGTAVAHMRYTSVMDPRSNLLGGVLSYAAPIRHKTDVALFHQQSGSVPLMQAIRLDRYTESFGALVSPTQGWDIMGNAHEIVESIVSVGRIRELEDDPRSSLWVMGTLTQSDLLHLAVVKADRVYLPKVAANSKGEPLDARFVFEKDLDGKRLFADELPFEGVVVTPSPETLLLCCNSFEADLAFDMSGQATPDFVWDTMIVNTPEEIQWDFNGRTSLQVDLAGDAIMVDIDMTDLTRNIVRKTARMISQPFTSSVIDEAFAAIHDAVEWVSVQPYVASNPAVMERLKAQVGHQLFTMYTKMAESDTFADVLDSVIRRMAKSVIPEKRDETYMTLEQMNYRLQISVALVGYVYSRLQMMGGAETNVQHDKNMSVWKESDFFNRMIGASRAKRVTI